MADTLKNISIRVCIVKTRVTEKTWMRTIEENSSERCVESSYRTIQFHFVRSYEIKFVANKCYLFGCCQSRIKFRCIFEEQQVYTACANKTSIREKVLEKKVKVASNN